MPIYEFQCQDCAHVWDELRKLSDPVPEHCPSCQKSHVEQRMTAAGFRLKGAGWYETDFKKDADSKRNLVDSKPADGASATDAAPTPAPSSAASESSTTPAVASPAPMPPAPAPAST